MTPDTVETFREKQSREPQNVIPRLTVSCSYQVSEQRSEGFLTQVTIPQDIAEVHSCARPRASKSASGCGVSSLVVFRERDFDMAIR